MRRVQLEKGASVRKLVKIEFEIVKLKAARGELGGRAEQDTAVAQIVAEILRT